MVSKTRKQGKTGKKERKDGLYLMIIKNKKIDATIRADQLPKGSQMLLSLAVVGGLMDGLSKITEKNGQVPSKK